jgi:transposase
VGNDFLVGCRRRLVGDTERQAHSRQVSEMRAEFEQLKQLLAELSLKNLVLKGSLLGKEPPWDK